MIKPCVGGVCSLSVLCLMGAVGNASAEVITLPSVKVEAESLTHETYLKNESTTASRADLTIKETPFSITVFPKRIIEEQGARDLSDVLRNSASLNQESNNAGRQPAFRSRGFLLNDSYGYLWDGQPLFGLHSPSIELIEQVEFFRGPASLQYGRAEPGGLVNLLRKRPTDERFATLRLNTGTHGYSHQHLDAGGRFGEDRRFGYRVNVASENSDNYRDGIYTDRLVGGASFDWKISDFAKLTLFADYAKIDVPYDTGHVIYNGRPADIPWKRNLDLRNGHHDSENQTFGYDLNVILSPNWKIRNQYTYQDYYIDRLESSKANLNQNNGNYTLRQRRQTTDAYSHNFSFDLIGDNRLFGMRHRTVLGVQLTELDRTLFASNQISYASNIFNPATINILPVTLNTAPTLNDTSYGGIYAEDFIGLTDQIDFMVGVRADKFRETTINLSAATPVRETVTENAVTPRFGLVYRPIEPLSLYVSRSRGFKPNGLASQGTNAGEILAPERSDQIEGGFKLSSRDNRLQFNAAAYEIKRENVAFYDAGDNFTRLIPGQRHQGLEFELIGELMPRWRVFASYAVIDADVIGGANDGRKPQTVPAKSARLWTSYDFAGALSGVSVFGGVFAQESTFADAANTAELPGYARVDVGATLRHRVGERSVLWRLNIDNLFDRRYYFGNNLLSITPAQPLTARIGLEIPL